MKIFGQLKPWKSSGTRRKRCTLHNSIA